MLDSLYIAATGMDSQQTYINVIANNLSNINTSGFKKETVSFQDIMNQQLHGNLANPGIQTFGNGSIVGKVSKEFSVGDIKKTDRSLDVAIQGNGFFEIYQDDGTLAYTRDGSFHISAQGTLVTRDNNELSTSIQIPQAARSLTIGADGTVSAVLDNGEDPVEIGRVELASFTNPSGLMAVGGNLYVPTDNSGDAYYAAPGEKDAGKLLQGYLESSNVNLVEELTNMVFAQRAYEINSKVIQASDEMLGIINNIRR